MEREDRKKEPRLLAMRIVWMALMAGVAIYAIVAWVLLEVMGVRIGDPASPLTRFLPWAAVAGMLLLVAGMTVARRSEEPGDRSTSAEARVDRYFNLRIVGLALQESAGLLVITLGLLAGAAIWSVAGGIAAVAVMAISGPSAEHVERLGR